MSSWNPTQLDLDVIRGLSKWIDDDGMYAGGRVYRYVLSRISRLADGGVFVAKDANGNATDLAALAADLNSDDKSVAGRALARFDTSYGNSFLDVSTLQPNTTLIGNSAWQWYLGAVGVNSGTSALAGFVRYYSGAQFEGRFGVPFDALSKFRADSRVIESNVAQAYLSGQGQTVQSIMNIGLMDSGAMAANVFNGDQNLQPYSPWAGTLVFQYLGVDSIFRSWILSPGKVGEFNGVKGDFKTEPGTYDLIASVASAQSVPTMVYQGLAAQLGKIVDSADKPRGEIVASLDATRAAATAFFSQYYGDLLDGRDFDPGALLPLYDPAKLMSSAAVARSDVGYRVGTIYDDQGDHALVGTDGVDVINGGAGDDEIAGNAGSDLLDGGTGNDRLDGGSGDDILVGGAGDDVLKGGEGDDRLSGGAGDDRFLFECGDGHDNIVQQDRGRRGSDTISFGAGVTWDRLWWHHSGKDLEIGIRGTDDSITIENFFDRTLNQVRGIQVTGNGHDCIDVRVDRLIDAMAAFEPAPALATTILPTMQPTLMPMLAAGTQ